MHESARYLSAGKRRTSMSLFLVVAHQTAASDELIAKLRWLASSGPQADFVLLVPATPLRHLWTWIDSDANENAQRRASEGAAALRAAGLSVVESVVGSPDPLEAIRSEVARHAQPGFESIVVCTLPPGISRWLRRDLPNQVRSQTSLEVISVIGRSPDKRASEPARRAAPL